MISSVKHLVHKDELIELEFLLSSATCKEGMEETELGPCWMCRVGEKQMQVTTGEILVRY